MSSETTRLPGGDEPLLKPADIAALFKVHPHTVVRWVHEGKLKSITTPGGHHRFRESDVRALLRGDSQETAA